MIAGEMHCAGDRSPHPVSSREAGEMMMPMESMAAPCLRVRPHEKSQHKDDCNQSKPAVWHSNLRTCQVADRGALRLCQSSHLLESDARWLAATRSDRISTQKGTMGSMRGTAGQNAEVADKAVTGGNRINYDHLDVADLKYLLPWRIKVRDQAKHSLLAVRFVNFTAKPDRMR
jgi:hypothetical protein